MRNFLKAFLFFLCWAITALFIHNHALNDNVKNIVKEVDKKQTTLVSKKENLSKIYKQLDKLKVTRKTINMTQGSKKSRFVAWKF